MPDPCYLRVALETSGEVLHGDSCAHAIVADRTVVGFLAGQRDVTERKAIAIALRESEARFRTLAGAAEDAIFIVNRDSQIEYANAASVEHFGKQISEVLGQKLHDAFPAAAAEMWRELTQVFDTGRRRRFEACFQAPAGERWLEIWLVPMPDRVNGSAAVMGVSRDITDRKRLEERFAQAQKMEAIGRLAGGIAHDFNNLLTAILGYAELLLDRVSDDESLVADVNEVKKAGERASRLTRQLLAFSRQQLLQPQVLDLNGVVDDVAKMLARVIGEDVRLQIVAQPGGAAVQADPGQLEQLILNLAVNARDAMPQGGFLRLTTANAIVDEELARRHGVMAGRYVSLAVQDSGSGMSLDVLQHVCEPFFTTKALGKGTGLGLATVLGVVKQANGFLTIDSIVGGGTTVTSYLPSASGSSEAPRTTRRTAAGDGVETILLVEDETGIRQVMRRSLERLGYTVLSAASPADAMAIAESSAVEIDLLLSDVVMPDISGPALAQRIIGVRPSIRVLYVSGFPNRVASDESVMSDRASFLSKPFAPHALALKVRECLDADDPRGICRAAAK